MPRRSILSAAERESLLALPDTKDELIRHYTFSESDLSIIRQRRGPANRLGFAVQLCYLRFPGVILGADEPPFPPLLRLVANQLKVGIESWDEYGQREQTRREHLVELQTVFGFQPFTIGHYRQAVQLLTELAMQTDKGIVLARALIEHLRRQSVIVPALNAVERASAEAITRANRRLYDALAEPLTRRRVSPALVLSLMGAGAVMCIVLFLTLGARGSWSFVLPYRGMRLAALVIVAAAVSISTVLFQTVTNNRILTPSIMGFDSLFVLIQTCILFFFGAIALSGLDPRLLFLVQVAVMAGFSILLYRLLFSGGMRSLHRDGSYERIVARWNGRLH